MSAMFIPSQPQCIAGGTKSGQVVIWDMRCGRDPVTCIQPSTKSHNYPIYSISYQHNTLEKDAGGNLVTLSSDGKLCKWSLRNMTDPISSTMIHDTKISRNSEITAMAAPASFAQSFVVGRDDGTVLPYDPSSSSLLTSSSSSSSSSSRQHTGPVLGLDYHPLAQGSYARLSNLLLSASADWTVKLWSVGGGSENDDDVIGDVKNDVNDAVGSGSFAAPLHTFSCNDYVFDARWSPVHPGTFAAADACGGVSLWDVTERLDAPIMTCQCDERAGGSGSADPDDAVAVSATSLRWNHAGSKIAVGDSLGRIHVFNVGDHWQVATAESWAQTNERVKLMNKSILMEKQ